MGGFSMIVKLAGIVITLVCYQKLLLDSRCLQQDDIVVNAKENDLKLNHASLAREKCSCDLCHDNRWLFILSSGRSGSTTLMDMLNAVPGFQIEGEAFGHLNYIHKAYLAAKKLISNHSEASAHAYKHGLINMHCLKCDIQVWTRHMLGVELHTKHLVIGFKETKYDIARDFDDSNVRNFFKEIFPCARFILNSRYDIDKQFRAQSKFQHPWRYEETNSVWDKSRLAEVNGAMVLWSMQDKNATHFPLERFRLSNFDRLLSWLGVSNCKYTSMSRSNYRDIRRQSYGFDGDEMNARVNGSCIFNNFKVH